MFAQLHATFSGLTNKWQRTQGGYSINTLFLFVVVTINHLEDE